MSALSVVGRRLAKEIRPSLFDTNPVLPSLERANKLLKLCADSSNLRVGESIHAQLIIRDQASRAENLFQANSLINLYSKCGKVIRARKLFDIMTERDVISWNSIMWVYLHSGFESEVLKMFKSMFFSGEPMPNEYIATVVLGSCSVGRSIEEGKQCHGYVLKAGLLSHEFVQNALVYMYSRCLRVEEAIRLLDEFPHPGVLAFNSALSGILDHGFAREGTDILRRMAQEDLRWDSSTYVSVLRLCSNLRDLKSGLQIHGHMLRDGLERDIVTNGVMINMYAKCGKIEYAQRIFDGSMTRNVVLWTSVMDAYYQNKCFEEVMNLLTKMDLEGVSPNEFTFSILLNSTADLSLLRHGDVLHGRIVKSGFKNHVMVGNALINMYSKSGSLGDAEKVFSRTTYRDIITWNMMICGYSHHGMGKEALKTFSNMLISREIPNYITFSGVLCACSHSGLLQEGLYCFNRLMKQFGVEPGLEHYTCIVALLSKAGMFAKAEHLLRTAPVEFDTVAWRVLLNACYVRRNYSLGKRVAEFVVEMDPKDVATYTLLSNIHAKLKEWEGVAKVRSLMRDRQVKKEPGVSWIEIRNVTHVFVSEDSQHPEIRRIYAKVREILSKIRPLGYSPDVAGVCHDVEEEQKEDNLSYHSEKLAVAYGLMKTPERSPLHIFKNLRICDDCHSAMKLISSLSSRVIIIRDAARFHHFRDGECSCGDYW
ncbi:PREDICTED: pentatricopeptide repeat-containing protein At5g39680 [Tarenaya hassleriana]|uniref:pentatricopeptide repeat-containing protein At5g39680 n=1 Tax=Tarenaya hassleriana TaxID=28532 RepID=UPI00053C9E5D|nr:PREDICTED: pentatricopeptide repeat-containing protein At5g39680 [Tarenaya hassleriana]XP_010528349.1 PREDICTED: pentatricopeptide repeat-containing protein At5g39680 [Tarenaya hassleriana]